MDLLTRFRPLEQEMVVLGKGLYRVLYTEIMPREDLPPFSRSTMDGFAVRARDTFGCSESEPALLQVIGEVAMGRLGYGLEVSQGQAAKIWTGGALPNGSDSVVMVEYTHNIDEQTIEVFRPVAPGENVIAKGEDFETGKPIFSKGHVLRPQDLGVLAGLGVTRVPVFRKPRVAIISTGDELVPPESVPKSGQIRDINSTTLDALVTEAGALPLQLGIVADDPDGMQEACEKALELSADIILLSGGSSVGRRDFTLTVFKRIKGAELLAHGVSVRPGKPTILARIGNRALFGLPGHVASTVVVFYLFVRPLIRLMAGLGLSIGLKQTEAVCGQEIPSVSGREDFIRVRLEKPNRNKLPMAIPVWGKSGLLRPLVKADGLLIVPRDSEGLEKGEVASVLLF